MESNLSVVLSSQLCVSPTNHTDVAHPEELSQASFSTHTSEMTINILGSVQRQRDTYLRRWLLHSSLPFDKSKHGPNPSTPVTAAKRCVTTRMPLPCVPCVTSPVTIGTSAQPVGLREPAISLTIRPRSSFPSSWLCGVSCHHSICSIGTVFNRYGGQDEGHSLQFIYFSIFSSYSKKYFKYNIFSFFGDMHEEKQEYPLWLSMFSPRGVMLTPHWPHI